MSLISVTAPLPMLRPIVIVPENRKQTGYPFVGLKPTQDSGVSRSVQQKREKRAFRK